MEFLTQLLLELILEGSIEISTNRKVSKWIRYPLIVLISSFFIAIFGLILLVGILCYKENIYISLFFIILSFVLLINGIIKFKKLYIEMKVGEYK